MHIVGAPASPPLLVENCGLRTVGGTAPRLQRDLPRRFFQHGWKAGEKGRMSDRVWVDQVCVLNSVKAITAALHLPLALVLLALRFRLRTVGSGHATEIARAAQGDVRNSVCSSV